MEVTINGLMQSLRDTKGRDRYYFDEDHRHGYHLHLFGNSSLVCVQYMQRKAKPINLNTFIQNVNSLCYGQRISERIYQKLVIGGGTFKEWERYMDYVEGLKAKG